MSRREYARRSSETAVQLRRMLNAAAVIATCAAAAWAGGAV